MSFQVGQLVMFERASEIVSQFGRDDTPRRNIFRVVDTERSGDAPPAMSRIESADLPLIGSGRFNRRIWVYNTRIRPFVVNLDRVTCQGCDEPIRDSPISDLCEQCQMSQCENCSGYDADGLTTVIVDDTTQEWCGVCVRRSAFTCGHCSEPCARDYSTSCDDCGRICPGCRDSTNYCDYCEEHYCDDDSHGSCGGRDDDGDGVILGYSHKPRPIFHGEGPVFLGLELEVQADDGTSSYVTAEGNGLIYCKADSSIVRGYEMVTHPMTYDWATAGGYPAHILGELRSRGAKPHSSCGMHIHVSRNAFADDAHVLRWFLLIYRNAAEMTKFSRRSEAKLAEWAGILGDSAREASIARRATKADPGRGPRYAAINAENEATLEVRIFAATLNAAKVHAALAFMDASVQYTRDMSDADFVLGGWAWASFGAWVNGREEYAPLVAEMTRLGIGSVGPVLAQDDLVTRMLTPEPVTVPAPSAAGAGASGDSAQDWPDVPRDSDGNVRGAFIPEADRPHGVPCGCGCEQVWDVTRTDGYGPRGSWVEPHNLTDYAAYMWRPF